MHPITVISLIRLVYWRECHFLGQAERGAMTPWPVLGYATAPAIPVATTLGAFGLKTFHLAVIRARNEGESCFRRDPISNLHAATIKNTTNLLR